MSSNVIIGDFDTTTDIPAEQVLSAAMDADLSKVLVIGVGKDEQFYLAASLRGLPAAPMALWLMELAKDELIQAANTT